MGLADAWSDDEITGGGGRDEVGSASLAAHSWSSSDFTHALPLLAVFIGNNTLAIPTFCRNT